MEDAIRVIACVQFFIIGVSHLVQPEAWVAWFAALRAKGAVGAFANGFLTLMFGSAIVAFHNVWSGLPMILTAIGWIQLAKAAVAFIFPALSLRGLDRARSPWQFRVAGVFSIGIAGVLLHVLTRGM
jgi:hypothetical protein